MATGWGHGAASAVTVAALVLAATATAPAASATTATAEDLRTVELGVPTADGLTLAATLRVPADAQPGGPAMVLVHGAGPGPREKYREEAEAFARAGVATLAYDKRTVGYSQDERSYSQLADDAVAAARVLRAQEGVDPARVGLWGVSEGGWVAPLAASRAPETAFLVVVGANGLEPLRQQVWAEAVKMQLAGVRGSLVDAASSGVFRLVDSAGRFPEARYDPSPVLRGLTLPVLGVWGALDRSTPPVESVAAFRADLERAGNTRHTLHVVAGAGHDVRVSTDGFDEGAFAPGYVDLVGSWIAATAAGRPPQTSVAGLGDQPRPTAPVPPSAWYESAAAHGVALGVMLVGFSPAAIGRRVCRGSRRKSGAVAARVGAVGGLVTVVGTLAYLVMLSVTRGGNAVDPGPLVAGRPVPWLVLQALALITVLAAVAVAAGPARRASTAAGDPFRAQPAAPRRVRRREALLLVGAAAFVPWALYWGLLSP